LDIYKIEFFKKRTVIHLLIPPAIRKTSQLPGFAKTLILQLPRLKYHLCDNEQHQSFADELENTELAHAFEHTLIDLIRGIKRSK